MDLRKFGNRLNDFLLLTKYGMINDWNMISLSKDISSFYEYGRDLIKVFRTPILTLNINIFYTTFLIL